MSTGRRAPAEALGSALGWMLTAVQVVVAGAVFLAGALVSLFALAFVAGIIGFFLYVLWVIATA